MRRVIVIKKGHIPIQQQQTTEPAPKPVTEREREREMTGTIQSWVSEFRKEKQERIAAETAAFFGDR